MEDDNTENPTLKANMQRLMEGRSIETIRAQMAEAGLAIGTGTLHKALQGKSGNRLGSLEKIAQFFQITPAQLLEPDLGLDLSSWPFSEELLAAAQQMEPVVLRRAENMLRAALDMPPLPTPPTLGVVPKPPEPDFGDEPPEVDFSKKFPPKHRGKRQA